MLVKRMLTVPHLLVCANSRLLLREAVSMDLPMQEILGHAPLSRERTAYLKAVRTHFPGRQWGGSVALATWFGGPSRRTPLAPGSDAIRDAKKGSGAALYRPVLG